MKLSFESINNDKTPNEFDNPVIFANFDINNSFLDA